MKVGYVVLYEDGELVISKKHTLLQKKIIKDYGEFEDINVPWKNDSNEIEKVQILDQVKSNYMKEWFEDCINLNILINFQNLDTSDCTDFSFMFYGCRLLQDLKGLQNWNVSNGINFSGMFEHCKSLQNINELQNWDVSNCEDFSYMFGYIKNLQEIFLPNTLKQIKWKIFWNCNKNLKIHWKNKIYTYEDLLEYKEF